MNRHATKNRQPSRRGAVTVEFAILAPVLLTLVVGVIESARLYETQSLLSTAAREGARLASMDREGMVPDGQTTNQKLAADIKNYLEAQGVDPDDVVVTIEHADTGADFDLDDPDNNFELFKLRVEIPYSQTLSNYAPGGEEITLGGEIVFRNARAPGSG